MRHSVNEGSHGFTCHPHLYKWNEPYLRLLHPHGHPPISEYTVLAYNQPAQANCLGMENDYGSKCAWCSAVTHPSTNGT